MPIRFEFCHGALLVRLGRFSTQPVNVSPVKSLMYDPNLIITAWTLGLLGPLPSSTEEAYHTFPSTIGKNKVVQLLFLAVQGYVYWGACYRHSGESCRSEKKKAISKDNRLAKNGEFTSI